MLHRRWPLLLIVTCISTLLSANSLAAAEEKSPAGVGDDIVTAESSPQFAKDYAQIDNLRCSVRGVVDEEVGLDVKSEKARRARTYLKQLLAEHPLRQGCHFPSSAVLILIAIVVLWRRHSQTQGTDESNGRTV